MRFTKLGEWMNAISLLNEKMLQQSMVDKKINRKEGEDLKRFCNHYLEKRSGILKNTQFKVEDIFGDIVNKLSISPE